MAEFNDHIIQARSNLNFLKSINEIDSYWDWKVTVTFNIAVHLANAHLSTHNLHYRKHKDVEYALNPQVSLSLSKIDEDSFVAYKILQNLSRRSRYLCNENPKNHSSDCFATFDKHFAKAIRYLDTFMIFIKNKYNIDFECINIRCAELKKQNMTFFNPIGAPQVLPEN